jgi:beta-phosphoglucomutase-like phosphatase (HAD superfamily)
MIEAIIFDMDGTLVDTEPFNTEIERRQFRLNKVVISEESHQKYLGVASDAMWKEIAEQHKLLIPVEEITLKASGILLKLKKFR